ncbi:MAG TPA: acylphosphatase [bacterium]|jgi:acylphosphatase
MTGEDRSRGHLWVTGVVQGVGFRYFARRAARMLGVGGFARNLPDGRVEIVAEGSRESVERFVAEVHRGPPASAVADVRVEWEPPTGAVEFLIR